jgi:hypothetical protein
VHGSEAECGVPSAGLGRYSCVAFGPISVDSTADKADYMHGDAAGSGLQQSLATDAEARIGVHESTPEELGAPNNDASRLIVAQSCAVEELYGMVARLLDMQAISAEEQVRGCLATVAANTPIRTIVRDRTAKQCYTRPRLRINQCG